jgi:hypothetical protein
VNLNPTKKKTKTPMPIIVAPHCYTQYWHAYRLYFCCSLLPSTSSSLRCAPFKIEASFVSQQHWRLVLLAYRFCNCISILKIALSPVKLLVQYIYATFLLFRNLLINISAHLSQYFILSSFAWLTTMCFDMLWTFRYINYNTLMNKINIYNSIQQHIKKYGGKRFW